MDDCCQQQDIEMGSAAVLVLFSFSTESLLDDLMTLTVAVHGRVIISKHVLNHSTQGMLKDAVLPPRPLAN